ncbi:transposase [Microbulbifer sp. CnH-101-E]|uniref:transposase n=1 Tax=unclassified Microbulbifer TaxID=2619833 RepID=UPI004039F2F6
MPKILSGERVVEYSTEFKVRVVALTNQLKVDTTTIANIIGLHPVMVYRWRQKSREGKLVEKPSRRINMTKTTKTQSQTDDKEIRRLKKQVEKLQKENDFLKKWEMYLKDPKLKDSRSWLLIDQTLVSGTYVDT